MRYHDPRLVWTSLSITSGEKIKKKVGQKMRKGNLFRATFGTVLTLTAKLTEKRGIQGHHHHQRSS
jgi:hypothetical protein